MHRLAVLLCALSACKEAREPLAPEFGSTPAAGHTRSISFAVHPLHNPRRLDAVFGPLMPRLAEASGKRFRLEASRSYDAFERKLAAREVEFALPNPYQISKLGDAGYHVIAKMGDDERFYGILLVRRDAGITSLQQLRGSRIAFPAPTALAATLMPQHLLAEAGLLPGRDYEPVFVGSQDSSIMTVEAGGVTAAATWPPPWEALVRERPELAERLEILANTPPLVNNGVVARDDVDPSLVSTVRRVLLSLNQDDAGRDILHAMELSRFTDATEANYAPVTRFLEQYTAEVGAAP